MQNSVNIQLEQFIKIFNDFVPSERDFLESGPSYQTEKQTRYLELFFKTILEKNDYYSDYLEDNIYFFLSYLEKNPNKISKFSIEKVINEFVIEITRKQTFDKNKIEKIIAFIGKIAAKLKNEINSSVFYLSTCLFLIYRYQEFFNPNFDIISLRYIPKSVIRDIFQEINKKECNFEIIYTLAFFNILPKSQKPIYKSFQHLPEMKKVIYKTRGNVQDEKNILVHMKFFCQHLFKKIVSEDTISLDNLTLLITMFSSGLAFKSCFCVLLSQLANHPQYYHYFLKFLDLLKGKVGAVILRSIFDLQLYSSSISLLYEAGDHIYQSAVCCAEYLPNYFVKELQLFQDPFISKEYGFFKIHVTSDNLSSFLHGFGLFMRVIKKRQISVYYEILNNHISDILERLSEAVPIIKNINIIQLNRSTSFLLYNTYFLFLDFIAIFQDQKKLFVDGQPIFDFIYYGIETLILTFPNFLQQISSVFQLSVQNMSDFYMHFLSTDLHLLHPIPSTLIASNLVNKSTIATDLFLSLIFPLLKMNIDTIFIIAKTFAYNYCFKNVQYIDALLSLFLNVSIRVQDRKNSLSILSKIILIFYSFFDDKFPINNLLTHQFFNYILMALQNAISFLSLPIDDDVVYFLDICVRFYFKLVKANYHLFSQTPLEGLFRMIHLFSSESARILFDIEITYLETYKGGSLFHQFDWEKIYCCSAPSQKVVEFLNKLLVTFPAQSNHIKIRYSTYQNYLATHSINHNPSLLPPKIILRYKNMWNTEGGENEKEKEEEQIPQHVNIQIDQDQMQSGLSFSHSNSSDFHF